jgi:hypothetical protein
MNIALYIQGQRVDLFKDENIEINLTSKNISDITKIFAEFSQGFSVPATPSNNAIFSHWYDATVDGTFNAVTRVDAYLEVNTLPFKVGVIQLDNCKLKGGNIYSYELTFFSKVVGLSDLMGNLELKDLDLTDYDHAYSISSVTNAMYQDTIANGDIYYPLICNTKNIDYGNGTPNDIKLSTNTLTITDFKPALRLVRIIEAMEQRLGVTFSRDFFGRSVFHNLYMWLHKDVKKVTDKGLRVQVDFTSKGNLEDTTGVAVDLTNNTILIPTKPVDVAFAKFFFVLTAQSGYTTVPYTFEIERENEGVVFSTSLVGSQWIFADAFFSPNKYKFFITSTLDFNFQIDLNIRYYIPGSVITKTAVFAVQTKTGNISISNEAPTIKLKDLFSSLINQFNLIIIPTSTNSFYIDTLDNWYSKGDTFDISHLINIDDITIKKPDVKKLIEFKYEPAGAILGKQYLDSNGIGYGDLSAKYDDIAGSDLSVKVGFENLQFERLQNASVTPSVTTNLQIGQSIDLKLEPYVGKPFIFYKNGLIDLEDTIYINGVALNKVFLTATEDNLLLEQVTNSLNFGSDISTYFFSPIQKSLYFNFWKTYIEDLYNQKTRVLNLKCKLPISILTKLSLNDKFIINKNKYKISNVKVNLINSQADIEVFTDYSLPADTIANEIPLTVDRTDITVDTDTITVDRISTYDALYSFIANGISRTDYTATTAKEYFEVKVNANTTWSVTKVDTGDGVTWFGVDKAVGNKSDYTMVNVNANSGSTRSGILRYIIGGTNFDLTITQ